MRLILLAVAALATSADAGEFLNPITPREIRAYCQHPATKPSPDERLHACIAFIQGAKQVAIATAPGARCRTQLAEIGPGPVLEAIYSMADDPQARKMPAGKALMYSFLAAAPACR